MALAAPLGRREEARKFDKTPSMRIQFLDTSDLHESEL